MDILPYSPHSGNAQCEFWELVLKGQLSICAKLPFLYWVNTSPVNPAKKL